MNAHVIRSYRGRYSCSCGIVFGGLDEALDHFLEANGYKKDYLDSAGVVLSLLEDWVVENLEEYERDEYLEAIETLRDLVELIRAMDGGINAEKEC